MHGHLKRLYREILRKLSKMRSMRQAKNTAYTDLNRLNCGKDKTGDEREKKGQLKKLKRGKLKLGIRVPEEPEVEFGRRVFNSGFSMIAGGHNLTKCFLTYFPFRFFLVFHQLATKREQWDIFLPFILGLITIFWCYRHKFRRLHSVTDSSYRGYTGNSLTSGQLHKPNSSGHRSSL